MKLLSLSTVILVLLNLASCNRSGASAYPSANHNTDADLVIFFTPQQMDSALRSGLDSVVHSDGMPLLASQILGKSVGDALYMVIIRSGPGQVEVHEQWDDVVIIRSGHGILRTGYQVDGDRKESSAGNWVGGRIVGGKEVVLSPGDFIIIPAMQGHQYIPRAGDSLTYWTIKVSRPVSK